MQNGTVYHVCVYIYMYKCRYRYLFIETEGMTVSDIEDLSGYERRSWRCRLWVATTPGETDWISPLKKKKCGWKMFTSLYDGLLFHYQGLKLIMNPLKQVLPKKWCFAIGRNTFQTATRLETWCGYQQQNEEGVVQKMKRYGIMVHHSFS